MRDTRANLTCGFVAIPEELSPDVAAIVILIKAEHAYAG
jgi:hypothetical protein